MDDLCESIAEEIRRQFGRGRTQAALAAELSVHPRMIGHIIWGERRIGMKTLSAIADTNPPWLHHILPPPLAALIARGIGRNGAGRKRPGQWNVGWTQSRST